jgi:hypothetical protein
MNDNHADAADYAYASVVAGAVLKHSILRHFWELQSAASGICAIRVDLRNCRSGSSGLPIAETDNSHSNSRRSRYLGASRWVQMLW